MSYCPTSKKECNEHPALCSTTCYLWAQQRDGKMKSAATVTVEVDNNQQKQYIEEDMLSFCEWVANERWREDFLEQRTLTTKDLLDIYNNLPK